MTAEGKRTFLTMPSAVALEMWNRLQRKKAEEANVMSTTTAQLIVLVKAIADSFAKKNTQTTPQEFLPFALDTYEVERLSADAISCYNYYNRLGLIPPQMKRALGGNSNLIKQLKE